MLALNRAHGLSQRSTQVFVDVDDAATDVVLVGIGGVMCDRSTSAYLRFHSITHDLGDDTLSMSVEYDDVVELGSLSDRADTQTDVYMMVVS